MTVEETLKELGLAYAKISDENKDKVKQYWSQALDYPTDYVKAMTGEYKAVHPEIVEEPEPVEEKPQYKGEQIMEF